MAYEELIARLEGGAEGAFTHVADLYRLAAAALRELSKDAERLDALDKYWTLWGVKWFQRAEGQSLRDAIDFAAMEPQRAIRWAQRLAVSRSESPSGLGAPIRPSGQRILGGSAQAGISADSDTGVTA